MTDFFSTGNGIWGMVFFYSCVRYFGPNGINYDCGKYETVLKGPNGVTCDDLVLLQLWQTLDWFLWK